MLSFYSGHYTAHEKELLYAMVTDNIKALIMLCNGECKHCEKKRLCKDLHRLQSHLMDLVINDEAFMEFMSKLNDIPFITTLK